MARESSSALASRSPLLKKRQDKYFTVAVTPERTGKTRYFVVQRLWLSGLALGSIVVISALLFVSVVGIKGWFQTRQLRVGQDRSTELRAQVNKTEEKMAALALRLENVDALEERLRELAQLSDPSRRIAIGPVGEADSGEAAPWGQREHPLLRQAREHLMSERMDGLLEEANDQVAQLESLTRHFEAMQARLASTPALRPAKGWLTSRFGERRDPMTGRTTMHRGIDVAASIGTAIVSPADGAVVKVEQQTGYGLVVMVDHGFGMMTKYAHLADSAVRPGDTVRRGERLGSVGMSGRSTGPHLHYEVLVDGVAADPEYFILD
jgi:murein DD-endopeptidase MepM/ murein hydrolase activator NlpD